MGTSIKTKLPAKHSAQILEKEKRPKGFVELLGRSYFSFLQGTSQPEEIVTEAIRLGYLGVGICDLNGLYGVARGFQRYKTPSSFEAELNAKENFKYLIGSELTLTDGTHITLIPMNKNGYQNLCLLITLGKRQAAKGFSRLSLRQIEKHSEDLLALPILPFDEDRFVDLQNIFKERLYIPIWRDLTWESRELNRYAFDLEKKYQAQLVATQRPFMHSAGKKPLFDVMTCIHQHLTLNQAKDRLIQNAERSFKSFDEICNLWADRPDLVEKSVDIANKIHFSLDEIRYRYPRALLAENQTPTDRLRELCEQGLAWRYPKETPSKVRNTIEHELNLISELQYEDYFLTLYEICQFAREKNILFQGRGSAANSVVCFCLGLTSVDPIEVDLLFERFLSKERGEPPDIDIDFEHSRREEVIQHIYEKYNEQHAAMVCTVIRYRSRMALRETAKVFGVPLDKVNQIIKFMGRDGMRRLFEDPQIHTKFGIAEGTWKLLLQMAHELHGCPRHLGIHTGGFIITHNPLNEMVPVEKATMNGRYVIQWNKDDVNSLKLMKIDILSLGMLTCLRRCFDLLREHKKINFNLASIPSNDKATYDMIGRAETVGVFQIESRAQMNNLPRMKPRSFYDLVIEVALIRPGPLQGGMVHPYLRRRQGLEKVTYAHPDLVPILHKTYGVPIFQEQVMKIAIVAAGFSPGESDELRRIMSSAWRKKATMDGIYDRILSGMLARGIREEYAQQIYKTLEGFASYGFPESHAASFALLTYASCYLKCHHPDVFVCALLNSQPMGFYAPRTLILEAQQNQVRFLPIDINESNYDYQLIGTLQQDSESKLLPVRIGFRSVAGIPSEILKFIESERTTNGIYKDLADFIRRTEFPRGVLIKLAASGAFQCFENNVRHLIWHIESLSLDQGSFLWGLPKEQFKKTSEDLDAENEDESKNESDIIPFESNWDRLRREYDRMGFSITDHPMSILRTYLNAKNADYRNLKYIPYAHSDDLKSYSNKNKIRVAGLIGITQRPPTAKGMCFITLEDEYGFMNIVITPDVYQQYRMNIYGRSLIEVQGTVEKSGPITNIKAIRVLPLG